MFLEVKVTEIYCMADDLCKEFAKHYYKEYVCKHLKTPISPFGFLLSFRGTLKKKRCTGISFVDSTLLRVCRNQRILIHKTFEGLAERGKCSIGWFFGFKLHLIINNKDEIRNFMFTSGNVENIALIGHSRHRSFNNFIANSLSAIAAYCFFEKKPSIDVNFINDGQLTLF